MLSMLVSYDEEGNIVATLDFMVARGEDGEPVGLIDFAAHEAAGGALTDILVTGKAVGSGTWPEWIGSRAHDFRVELEPGWSRATPRGGRTPHRVKALVHKTSGLRRERSEIEAAIAQRIAEADGGPADIRDIVGGPQRPLILDGDGNTVPRQPVQRPELPVVSRGDR